MENSERFQPGCQFGVAAFPRKVSRILPAIAFVERVSAVVEEQVNKAAVVGCSGGEERRETPGLRLVDRRTMRQQQTDNFRISAQGDGSMERLILLRIAAHRLHIRSGS